MSPRPAFYRTNRRTTNNLKILRVTRRWTQGDVSDKLGYPSKFRYWQIENDLRIPSLKERARLARIFGVHEAEIFPALARVA